MILSAIRPAAGCLLGVATAVAAQEPPPALSPRNASYTIEVSLDTEAKTLDGNQILIWRNIQESPAAELRFHLYWNAWRNDLSTWMRDDRLRGRSDRGGDIAEEEWGWIEVDSVRLLREQDGDVVLEAFHDSPDDGNPHDRTVLVVPLPEPVQHGEEIRVAMDWRAKIPRTFARTGYTGNYYFIAHWFPKLGVFEGDGWNCHQYHAGTEYFSDYGVYDVRINLPAGYVLGATGREVDRQARQDGTIAYRHVQADVHAFTWTASRHYVVREKRFEREGLPAVDMRLLIQPEHLSQAERHLTATEEALAAYGSWYGPYPYGHVTVVDPAYNSGAGGMEYPTIFTCGTRLFNPFGADSPESVTIHEAGHQFWYGVVGNNEFEHAWIDEGLNTFSTIRTLEHAYPPRKLSRRYLLPPGETSERRGFFPLFFDSVDVPRFEERRHRFRPSADSDVPDTPTYRYYPGTGGDLSYSKTALWLTTLERHLGWPKLRTILSTFYQRHRFGHPVPEDLFAIAREVAGAEIDGFFEQVHYDDVVFDYAVDSVASLPAAPEGFVFEDGEPVYRSREDEDDGPWRTEVIVKRRGGGVFPVDVLMVFEDGEQRRERWDGRARWKRFVVEHDAKLAHAVVDPERVLMLDVDFTNNSKLREPKRALPAAKWGSRWTIWFQDALATFAFFI